MVGISSVNLRQTRIYFFVISILVVGMVIGISGWEYWEDIQLSAIPGQPSEPPAGQITLVIKIPARILEVHSDGKPYKRYHIAVGKSNTPTPTGDWMIVWKSYRSGVFGTRYFGLNVPWGGYGIHGTDQPWSIGGSVSQGCIRMRNKDVEELFEWVPVGTPVRIEDQPFRIQRSLKLEISGADVVQLQRKLSSLGYLEGRADGFFNRDTELAVKRFQHDRGLKVTGVVDRETLNLLGL